MWVNRCVSDKIELLPQDKWVAAFSTKLGTLDVFLVQPFISFPWHVTMLLSQSLSHYAQRPHFSWPVCQQPRASQYHGTTNPKSLSSIADLFTLSLFHLDFSQIHKLYNYLWKTLKHTKGPRWATSMKLRAQRKAVSRELMGCIYTRSVGETKATLRLATR